MGRVSITTTQTYWRPDWPKVEVKRRATCAGGCGRRLTRSRRVEFDPGDDRESRLANRAAVEARVGAELDALIAGGVTCEACSSPWRRTGGEYVATLAGVEYRITGSSKAGRFVVHAPHLEGLAERSRPWWDCRHQPLYDAQVWAEQDAESRDGVSEDALADRAKRVALVDLIRRATQVGTAWADHLSTAELELIQGLIAGGEQ